MYDLLCNYFGPNAVNVCCFLLLAVPIVTWLIVLRREEKNFEGYWKYHLRTLGRAGVILGILALLQLAYAEQKEEQQREQRQAVIELFTSITEVLGNLGESAISTLRTYLTPEEKKSRLLPVGLATNDLSWVSESQCVTSQVREAWQRVPIRRASFRQSLPFPVIVGSNTYEEVFISSSGIIGFDAPKGSEMTRPIPYEEAADHVYLALLWGRVDFKPRLGSKMWYGLKADGNFVASYDTVFIDGDTNAIAKVQVEFIRNGDMILRYSDLPACTTNAHTAGFQNLDGGWTLSPDNIRSNTAIYLKAFGPLDLTVQDSDTDGDGISDYYELYPTNGVSITDPCNIDTDGDGLMDPEEVFTFGTNPSAFSSDGSGTGDLWRVIGGLTPSDAPYTNAAPSSSVGILTVTTYLENAPAGGGAVLRIADKYIPVLAGTTLVSRIAVPRGATNVFILARGANCDNAVARVAVEASSFTKLRDPSAVFSWSFTLNPSCVTASGTLVMPSYTITPALVCFHSPTSSVCRITSDDPDIFFWTTQGMVREYAPQEPEIQPNSFTNGTIQISLVSMDMALATRASVTNIPVHFCNPYGGVTNAYPDAPEYEYWCKFVDNEHVWATGFNATNCPCLIFTNAFNCLCSGSGQRPCTCAHAVYDAKAMPQEADQTNVLGHASLVIGGTNDQLSVTVPGSSYRSCSLCACSKEVTSSASIYRQTSCINVTPGGLTTNGAFSVAGMKPSTNFADTVFIYKISDCSGAQTVTSYNRKDYTVLGTAVYPTDPGHSVSNWFIVCNVTNALTLWSGVALPSDTGDVSLSVTVESGTPLPQLYVYNRVAQTNELLITQGQFTFTQNLGTWRDTYCDTNGYVQAYLFCASGGVARVTHSYETYSGQPYALACNANQPFRTVKIDINGDYNRDESPIDNPGETNEVTFAGPHGFVILANNDDDNANQSPDAIEDDIINGSSDLNDIAEFQVSRFGLTSEDIPSTVTAEFKVIDPNTGTLSDAVRIFSQKSISQNGGAQLTWPNSIVKTCLSGSGYWTMGIEGIVYGKQAIVKMTLKDGANVIGTDEFRVLTAPFFVSPNNHNVNEMFVSFTSAGDILNTFSNGLSGLATIRKSSDYPIGTGSPTMRYIQDHVEFGYTRTATGQATFKSMQVILGLSPTDPNLQDLLTTNRAFYAELEDRNFGDLMVTPETNLKPYGSIVCGSSFAYKEFFVRQGVQPEVGNLVELDNTWMQTPHVDNLVAFIPYGDSFKVLVADLQLAIDILSSYSNTVVEVFNDPRTIYCDSTYTAGITNIQAKLNTIYDTLENGLGISKTNFIHIPVAFDPTSLDSVRTFLPDMVNMQYVKTELGKKVFLPKAYFEPFYSDPTNGVKAALNAIGISDGEIQIVPTGSGGSYSPFNSGLGGDVHCISNPSMIPPSNP